MCTGIHSRLLFENIDLMIKSEYLLDALLKYILVIIEISLSIDLLYLVLIIELISEFIW